MGASERLTDLEKRARTLHESVATSPQFPEAWRERRALAERTERLTDLMAALRSYRTDVDTIAADGDGTRSTHFLENARSLWVASASDWGVPGQLPAAAA
jgi:hypothetical protein